MNIILDSNIIIQDFRLKGADAILFLNNYNYAVKNSKCFISRVTYLEVLNNFEKQLKQKITKIESQLNSIKRQTDNLPFDFNENYVQTELKNYKEYFNGKLKEFKISIIPLPAVSHQKILNHILNEKPPFNGSDSGYKDFLIFHTILENVIKYNTDVVFISNDNDFGEKNIHSELEELNPSKHKIILRKSLKEINQIELKENIKRGNAQLRFITELFEETAHQSEYLESLVDYMNSKNFLEILPIHLVNYIDLIKDTPDIDMYEFYSESGEIISVNAINKNLVIVDAELDAYLAYSFYVDQKDLHIFRNLPEEVEFEYYIEENNALVWLGVYLRINATVQSDKSGMDIKKVELSISQDNYLLDYL